METDHTFMLKLLTSNYELWLNIMKTKIYIPHTMIVSGDLKVQYWLWKNKKGLHFKKLDEALNKIRVAYAYFLDNKSLEELKDMGDYDPYADQLHKMSKYEKEHILFMIRINMGQKGQYHYFVSKCILEAIKKSEFGSKIDMVYTDPGLMLVDKPAQGSRDIKYKPQHFYKVIVRKLKKKSQDYNYDILHLNSKGYFLNWADWEQYHEQVLELQDFHNTYSYKSKNNKCNEIMRSACDEVMKVFILKTKLDIREATFSFAINDFNQVYIIDTRNIMVYDKRARECVELNASGYPTLDHVSKFTEQIREINEKKDNNCFGIYCDIKRNLNDTIIDDKEELNNLYLMKENDKEFHYVEYKSIVLDMVERYKTIERIRKNCPKLTKQNIDQDVSEGLLFKFRKYYMIADLQFCGLFTHMNFPNLYEKRKVCSFCKAMYNKIDMFRVTKKNEDNIFQKDKTVAIQKEIERVLTDSNNNLNKRIAKEKERFSKTFYRENLPNAYKPINKKFEATIDIELLGRYEKAMIHREKVKQELKIKKRREAMIGGKTKGLPSVNSNKNDLLSLRFHLGSPNNVDVYEHGCISTKSSIELTSLQGQMNRLDKIAYKNTNVKLGMNEKEFYDLIMCPYYGQGKRNTSRLKDFNKTRSEMNLGLKSTDLKVTLDRLKFMDSHEVKKQLDPDLSKRIKAKEEKENQEQKLAEEEKQLLTNNAGLAKSVLNEARSLGLLGLEALQHSSDYSQPRSKNVFKIESRKSLSIKY